MAYIIIPSPIYRHSYFHSDTRGAVKPYLLRDPPSTHNDHGAGSKRKNINIREAFQWARYRKKGTPFLRTYEEYPPSMNEIYCFTRATYTIYVYTMYIYTIYMRGLCTPSVPGPTTHPHHHQQLHHHQLHHHRHHHHHHPHQQR